MAACASARKLQKLCGKLAGSDRRPDILADLRRIHDRRAHAYDDQTLGCTEGRDLNANTATKRLYLEDMPLADIARREGTPCYVYSRAAILERFHAYEQAFGDVPHKVCYAVKANSNLAILSLLAEAGAGFDIVSGGELFRVLKAGADPENVVFSGVGKTAQETRLRARTQYPAASIASPNPSWL